MVWPVHVAPHDYYRYTNYGLEYLVHEAGFRTCTIVPSNGYWFSMISLLLLRAQNPFLGPIVFCLNLVGLAIGSIEKNRELPLVHYVIAKK